MESEWIEHLRRRPGTELLGDDAALLGDQLVTVDMLTEGVDFLLAQTPAEWIGRKALAVNLSDIAAMAGVPKSFLVSVALPKSGGLQLAERLYSGMEPFVERYDLTLVGGDTNTWDGGLVISVTVLGQATRHDILKRSAGRPDDRILVTGPLGGSILRKQFFFEPRVPEALFLNEHFDIHAAMDISDGLALDLHRLAAESGVGATLDSASIPVSRDAFELSRQTGRTSLDHALSDGEDFELLLTTSPQEAQKILECQPLQKSFGVTLYDIGCLTAEPGLRIIDADGVLQTLEPRGFLH